MCNMNFLYVKAFESYHMTDKHTDTTEIVYYASSRVVKKAYVPVALLTGTLKVSIDFTFNSHNPYAYFSSPLGSFRAHSNAGTDR